MGRGNKHSSDAPMSRPTDLLSAVGGVKGSGEGAGGSNAAADQSYCSIKRVIPFRIIDGASPAVGDEARLRLGSPPAVVVSGNTVGELTEPHAQAMASCLRMGYRMRGSITSVDLTDGTAAVSVTGEQAQAA